MTEAHKVAYLSWEIQEAVQTLTGQWELNMQQEIFSVGRHLPGNI